jgi:hypothetical protein
MKMREKYQGPEAIPSYSVFYNFGNRVDGRFYGLKTPQLKTPQPAGWGVFKP